MKKTFSLCLRLVCWLLTAALLIGGYVFVCSGQYRKNITKTMELLRESVNTQTFPDETRGMLGIVLDTDGQVRSWMQSHLELSSADSRELLTTVAAQAKDGLPDSDVFGYVYYKDVKYHLLRRPLASGCEIAAAECSAEQAMAGKIQYGGYALIAANLLLLPVFLLLRKRRPSAAEPDKSTDKEG